MTQVSVKEWYARKWRISLGFTPETGNCFGFATGKVTIAAFGRQKRKRKSPGTKQIFSKDSQWKGKRQIQDRGLASKIGKLKGLLFYGSLLMAEGSKMLSTMFYL
jgi:hypothetical protein